MKIKKFSLLLAIIILLSIVSFGCTDKSNKGLDSNKDPFNGKYIVSSEYAVEKISDEDVIFVDARGSKDALKGTIDGAIALTWQELSNMDGKSGDEKWGSVLNPDELAEKLGSIGLDPEKEIILFSSANKGWGEDGRILWTLKIAGYNKVYMVDGGINALSYSGAKLVKKINTLDPISLNIENTNYDTYIETTELALEYDNYKIIDTREKDEFNGAVKYGETAGGHLPGAINIPFTELFNEKGNLKSNAEIIKIFEDKGLSTSDLVATYCTAGIRSAYVQLILEMCGFENTKNYDGSYYRWSAVYGVE